MLIATTNRLKAQLYTPIFEQYSFDVITLNEILSSGLPPVEDGLTAVDNAVIKARHYHSPENSWVFGDDVGLEIQALNNEPGVQQRRWGGRFSDDVDDQDWLNYLLDRMRNISPSERTAEFVDGWALIDPEGNVHTRELRVSFEIAEEPIRSMVPGSPVMAVAIGLPQKPAEMFALTKNKWDEWGILSELLDSGR